MCLAETLMHLALTFPPANVASAEVFSAFILLPFIFPAIPSGVFHNLG